MRWRNYRYCITVFFCSFETSFNCINRYKRPYTVMYCNQSGNLNKFQSVPDRKETGFASFYQSMRYVKRVFSLKFTPVSELVFRKDCYYFDTIIKRLESFKGMHQYRFPGKLQVLFGDFSVHP